MGKRYTLQIRTEQGEEKVKSDDIGDTLLALLDDYKARGITVLDIKIDRGSLEQHFIEIARGNGD